MKIEDIRRNNLAALVSEFKTIVALAEAAEINESYLSTILSGARNAGSRIARRLEKAGNLPSGWLDIDHEATATQIGLTRTEQELITLFRSSSKERQKLLLSLARMKV